MTTIITATQRKDYKKLITTQGFRSAWAICRRDCILQHDTSWWDEHSEEVRKELAELADFDRKGTE